MRAILWVGVAILALLAMAAVDKLPSVLDILFTGVAFPVVFLAGRMSTRIAPLNFIKDYINVD